MFKGHVCHWEVLHIQMDFRESEEGTYQSALEGVRKGDNSMCKTAHTSTLECMRKQNDLMLKTADTSASEGMRNGKTSTFKGGTTSSERMERILTAIRAVFSTTPNHGWYLSVGLRPM
jgi:hypothetical protein